MKIFIEKHWEGNPAEPVTQNSLFPVTKEICQPELIKKILSLPALTKLNWANLS